MIDSFLLWLFVAISRRWFSSVVFATDPETDRTTSIFFFDQTDHAHRFMEIVQNEKLDHRLNMKGDTK